MNCSVIRLRQRRSLLVIAFPQSKVWNHAVFVEVVQELLVNMLALFIFHRATVQRLVNSRMNRVS